MIFGEGEQNVLKVVNENTEPKKLPFFFNGCAS